MNQIYYSKKTTSGFYGIPQQITDKIKEHEVSTKEAIDNQTEVLQETITIQTETQHEDSVALRQQQHEDAAETRTVLQNLFGALARTFKNIFTKDKGDISGETFYEMVQRENDETQRYISAHTNTLKDESDETQSIINTTNTKLENLKNTLNVDLTALKQAIDANTSGDTVNMNGVIDMLQTEGNKITNAVTGNTQAVNSVKSSVDNIATKNETGFNRLWEAIRNN